MTSQLLGVAVIAGGGFIAYRYLNRGERGITPAPKTGTAAPTETAVEPGTTPPITGEKEGEEAQAPTTNAQWGTLATDRLVTMGWNGQTVSTIIGKYLHRLALSNTDADVLRAAIGQVGQPPENGPWPITIATPAPTVIPPVVTKPPVVVTPPPAPKPAPAPPPKPKVWKYTWVKRSEWGKLTDIAKRYAHAPKGTKEVQQTFTLIATKNGFIGWKGSTVMRRRTIYVPAWKLV